MVFIDEEQRSMQVADWIIIGVYFLGCIIVGLWVSSTSNSFLVSPLAKYQSKGQRGTLDDSKVLCRW